MAVNGVYHNKTSNGRTGYRTGKFYSIKNNASYIYRSAYEYAYFEKLEQDESVIQYIVEPFQIPYIDEKGKKRTYKPDIIVLYENGILDVVEIKPKSMLRNIRVQRKASAAKQFIQRNYKDCEINYNFITEEEIFSSDKEYKELCKRI